MDAHACRISTPRQGVSISDKAWEWTVYFVQGVWRCPVKIDKNIIPRFFSYHHLKVKSGMEATPDNPWINS